MNTVIKLVLIVSLLLAPFAGPAATLLPAAEHASMAPSMHQDEQTMAGHDCCEPEQQTASQTTTAQPLCDDSCGDCQHHCGSSASALLAMPLLPVQYHPLQHWPHSQGVPLSHHENQIRPPMPA